MQLNINGIETRYVLSNEGGGPWLTFIHQLGGDLSIWNQLAGYFRNDFTVLRYDVRGRSIPSGCPPSQSPAATTQAYRPPPRKPPQGPFPEAVSNCSTPPTWRRSNNRIVLPHYLKRFLQPGSKL